ncbi:hypothetical protein OS176_14465, partial [Xanthomonadaceae bacterium XH05]|nr:hypothetical protein [Xanthomonadaceae bacterium XH05]
GKPVLHYFDGRGRMEPIRWLLAAAGVEFEEQFLKTRDDLARLRNDGSLMFLAPSAQHSSVKETTSFTS